MTISNQSDAEVEARILDAADSLFYAHGVDDVTVATIRDAANVSMRRLYSFASSKAELVALWLQYRHIAWTAGFAQRIDENIAAGAEPVDAIFAALTNWMTETRFRGCGFINTHAGASDLTAEHETIIREHKAALAQYLDTVAGKGDVLAVLIDGAIVQSSIFANADPIHLAHRAAKALSLEE